MGTSCAAHSFAPSALAWHKKNQVRLSLSPQGAETCSYLRDDAVIEDSYTWGHTVYLDWALMTVFIKVGEQEKQRNK